MQTALVNKCYQICVLRRKKQKFKFRRCAVKSVGKTRQKRARQFASNSCNRQDTEGLMHLVTALPSAVRQGGGGVKPV
jgi:hypothetical protein